MFSFIGLAIVSLAVLGGFAMAGGRFHVLMQPNELVLIGGACLGTLIVAAVGNVRGQVVSVVVKAFSNSIPRREDYLDLLKLLYELFTHMRRNGAVALDEHIADVRKSSIFRKYPSFFRNPRAVEFLVDAFKQVVNGTASAEELEFMLEAELETHHEEKNIPIGLLKTAGDALPGLGIVAAVLGIIHAMGALDQSPEILGGLIGAALVGTFAGIFLSYAILAPIAQKIKTVRQKQLRLFTLVKQSLLAFMNGAMPQVAVEFGRKTIPSKERPTIDVVENETTPGGEPAIREAA
jgi:chemotaxis protein MotA